MELIASALYTVAEYSLAALFTGYAAAVVIFLVSTQVRSPALKRIFIAAAVIVFIYSNLNMFTGHSIAGSLINSVGEQGTAIVVNIRQTNNQYNDYWIMEYSVVIETKDGNKVESKFEDADFNVFPKPKDGYVYPNIGEKFSVKYIKSNPKAFIIISDDGSPYAKRLRCSSLLNRLNEAKLKYSFDNTNEGYRKKYRKLIEDCFVNSCIDSVLVNTYRAELEKLK